jgi:hypothetical protein
MEGLWENRYICNTFCFQIWYLLGWQSPSLALYGQHGLYGGATAKRGNSNTKRRTPYLQIKIEPLTLYTSSKNKLHVKFVLLRFLLPIILYTIHFNTKTILTDTKHVQTDRPVDIHDNTFERKRSGRPYL